MRITGRWIAVLLHGVMLGGLITLYAMVAAQPVIGANIGAGLVGLVVLVFGLPWTVPIFIDPYQFDGLNDIAWHLIYFGPAVLNLSIHALIAQLRSPRHRAPLQR